MAGHVNKNIHKAQHGGYYDRPSQQGVNAQHSFWRGLNAAAAELNAAAAAEVRVSQTDVQPEGTQLKIKF